MAAIVVGIATSHSPMLSLPGELWQEYGKGDRNNPDLLAPPDGRRLTYDELLAQADPSLARRATPEVFQQQYAECQRAINVLRETLAEASPDTVLIVGDDQEEVFFNDNMPAISIYWGDSLRLVPRHGRNPVAEAAMWGYGKEEKAYPVDSALGLHLVQSLTEAEFDVGHSRYLRENPGGEVGPCDYIPTPRATPPHRQGMPHAYGFVMQRLLDAREVPLVPVTLNTCYPPNQPTPRRCYALGRAIRRAIEEWGEPRRVAVVASGGLSHFVLDEEIDHMVLEGLRERDADRLANLPRQRINGAASEVRNWITAGGALEDKEMEIVGYVPVCRTPAGSGGGWGFARWR